MKHYFLGSNTPTGFYGYYNEANAGGNRLFILKGGSGVGKHTFMKRIAKELEKENIEVEYCHCSNDVNSLDGVLAPSIGVGIIDGTAPHMTDPKYPGCFDEIIDLGKYIDSSKVLQKRGKIEKIVQEKKQRYKRAYTYLFCAKAVNDDARRLVASCIDEDKLYNLLSTLPRSLTKNCEGAGKIKNIFASAYTSSGYVDYIGTLKDDKRTIAIKGSYEVNKRFMGAVYESALAAHADMTVCHSILDVNETDHILLKSINIISVDEHNKFNEADETISLKDIINKDRLADLQKEINIANGYFDKLIQTATEIMHSCSTLHKELESIYTPAMDFESAEAEFEKTLKKIRGYIL